MAFKLSERTEETSTSTGTGTLNLAGATTNNRTFVAGIGTGNTTKFIIKAASGAWERSSGTVTDASPDTLSRTLIESSTGALLDLPAGTHTITCDWSTQDAMSSWESVQTYICGLIVTKNSGGNTLDISAGACYDPSSGKIISYAGATGVSAGSLGASQWNQVYIYDNAGTATIEVKNNEAPPSTAYAGTARQGGTNNNRRWIGSFLTTSGSAIYAQDVAETARNQIRVVYTGSSTVAAPFRILSNVSTPTSFGSETTLVGVIPRYVATDAVGTVTTGTSSGSASVYMAFSLDATTNAYSMIMGSGPATAAGISARDAFVMPIRPSTPAVYYLVAGTSPQCSMDVTGYFASR